MLDTSQERGLDEKNLIQYSGSSRRLVFPNRTQTLTNLEETYKTSPPTVIHFPKDTEDEVDQLWHRQEAKDIHWRR